MGNLAEPDRRWRDFLDGWVECNKGTRQIAGGIRDLWLTMSERRSVN